MAITIDDGNLDQFQRRIVKVSNAFWEGIQKRTVSKTFDQFPSFMSDVENDGRAMSFERKDRDEIANPLFVDEFDVETNGKVNKSRFKSGKIKMLILL